MCLTLVSNTLTDSIHVITQARRSIPDHRSIHRGVGYGDVGDDFVFQLLAEADAQLGIVAIDS